MFNRKKKQKIIAGEKQASVETLKFVPSIDGTKVDVYVRYKDCGDWVALFTGLAFSPDLQSVRDADRNIMMNSGSYQDAHFYLRSADGNNMTTAYYVNDNGGAIQSGNNDTYKDLNLQPLGGKLTYNGNEVATQNWTTGQNYLKTELDPTVPDHVKSITESQINVWNGKEDVSNKSISVALGNSDTLYPTQKAVKTFVNNSITANNANFIPASQKGQNNGVATLDTNGKIPNAQIPALAISDTFVVNTQSAMLALTAAEKGDIAIRTDLNKSFVLSNIPANTLSNWQELLSPTVTNSDHVPEGSANLYFTQARARQSINVSGDLAYNSSTGVISYTAPVVGNGTFTISGSNGLNGSGSFSANQSTGNSVTLSPVYGTAANTVAQGNDSRIINGQTAYSWGNHTSAGYEVASNKVTTLTSPNNITYPTSLLLSNLLATKQTTLVSGTNIKTINGSSLLGSGDITISTGTTPNNGTLTMSVNGIGSGSGTFSANQATNSTFTVTLPSYGTTSGTVAQGNDSRIVNGQTAFGWGNHSTLGYLKSAENGLTKTGEAVKLGGGLSENTHVDTQAKRLTIGNNINDIFYQKATKLILEEDNFYLGSGEPGIIWNATVRGNANTGLLNLESRGPAGIQLISNNTGGHGINISTNVLTTNRVFAFPDEDGTAATQEWTNRNFVKGDVAGYSSMAEMSGMSSFIGSISEPNDAPYGNHWWNVMSVRHRNGSGDGTLYGMQMANPMTESADVGRLFFRNQVGSWGSWFEIATQNWVNSSTILNQSSSAQNASLWINGEVNADTYLRAPILHLGRPNTTDDMSLIPNFDTYTANFYTFGGQVAVGTKMGNIVVSNDYSNNPPVNGAYISGATIIGANGSAFGQLNVSNTGEQKDAWIGVAKALNITGNAGILGSVRVNNELRVSSLATGQLQYAGWDAAGNAVTINTIPQSLADLTISNPNLEVKDANGCNYKTGRVEIINYTGNDYNDFVVVVAFSEQYPNYAMATVSPSNDAMSGTPVWIGENGKDGFTLNIKRIQPDTVLQFDYNVVGY